MRSMIKRCLWGVLVAFVVFDLALTFWRTYHLPIDGDLVPVVFPSPFYSAVLHDPFGWAVLTKNAVYAAPNRFFAHATMYAYWRRIPLLLHAVASPISSLYLASALFCTGVQAALLGLLGLYIRRASGQPRGYWGWAVVLALLTPLFQTSSGFYEQIGLVDASVTYVFFYALPLALLLVLLWPFFRAACLGQPLRLAWPAVLPLVALMLFIAFNGVIATAAIAVLLLCLGGYWAWGQWRAWRRSGRFTPVVGGWLSAQAVGLLLLLAVICLYSIYIGKNNIENSHDHTVWQLYQLLPQGIWIELNYQAALPLLLAALLLNGQLLRWIVTPSPERQRALLLLRWIGLFAGLFVLLLPWGGYRSYRPFLLRNDSISPILVALFFAYGLTTYVLLFQLKGLLRGIYLVVVVSLGAYLWVADYHLDARNTNDCQRWALDQVGRATVPAVQLSTYCNVLTWYPFTSAEQSEVHAAMLQYWGITTHKQLFYQK